MMQVDIVVPVHGNWKVTERCLDSLKTRDACVRQVIVVDDASTDETPERLRTRADITFIRNDTSVGYGGASNAGAALARADAVLFLNNDTIVPPGAVARLAAALEADPSIGAAGAKLVYSDGTIQSAGCTFLEHLETWRLYAHLDTSIPQANVAGDFIYLTGAALLVRRELFQALGGFDLCYRNGVEDLDLCMRIWQRGSRVRYVPEATIVHLEGATRGRSDGQRENWRRFKDRWSDDLLAQLPRYRAPEMPHFIFEWRDRTPLDGLVRMHIARMFRAHGSVRATFERYAGINAGIERVRSAIERRNIVTVTNTANALSFDGRVAAVRLGFFDAHLAQRDAPPVVVTDHTTPKRYLDETLRALGDERAIVVDSEWADARGLQALRRAPLAVFAGSGDGWGLLGGESLAAGACVVAPPEAPFLMHLPSDVAVIAELDHLASAVAQIREDDDERTALGARARHEILLRFPAAQSVERIQELGRALTGGIADPAGVEITRTVAQALADSGEQTLRSA